MPTAFLTASTFEVLPFLGTPGAATVGHALVWSESPKGFTLSPISVGPDQFSGVLPISKGGTGTSNGSITGTGALTFAAGGTNQNITLQPSGTGYASTPSLVVGDNPESPGLIERVTTLRPSEVVKLNGQLSIEYSVASNDQFHSPVFISSRGRGNLTNPQPVHYGDRLLLFGALPYGAGQPGNGITGFIFDVEAAGSGQVTQRNPPSVTKFMGVDSNGGEVNFLIVNAIQARLPQTTESTSTTTGAVRIDGGLGVAKNTNIGGNLRFAGGTVPATATSAGTTGDIRYDGSHLYICTATNTWVRAALSTW